MQRSGEWIITLEVARYDVKVPALERVNERRLMGLDNNTPLVEH